MANSNKSRDTIFSIITLAVAAAGLFVAFDANMQSNKALILAEEANQIAYESLTGLLSILPTQYAFTNIEQYKQLPCYPDGEQNRTAIWHFEEAKVIDVSNLGNKTITIRKIIPMAYLFSYGQENNKVVRITFNTQLFRDVDEFENWSNNTEFLNNKNYSFGNLPLQLMPGETKRMLLKVVVDYYLDGYAVEDLYNFPPDEYWGQTLKFHYSENALAEVYVGITKPAGSLLEYYTEKPLPSDFSICS